MDVEWGQLGDLFVSFGLDWVFIETISNEVMTNLSAKASSIMSGHFFIALSANDSGKSSQKNKKNIMANVWWWCCDFEQK